MYRKLFVKRNSLIYKNHEPPEGEIRPGIIAVSEKLHEAVTQGDFELIDKCLERNANIDFTNLNGETPLHYCCAQGNVEIIEVLVNAKSRLDAKDQNGRSPLHVCAKYGKTNALEYLLFLGANIDLQDNVGNTALHLAAIHGHIYSVKSLLNHNADIHILNKIQKNPLDGATERGRCDIVKLLSKYTDEESSVDRNTNEVTPSEIKSMGLEDITIFKERLKLGKSVQQYIHLMIVGPYEAGKTCLTYALLNQKFQSENLNRTDGIKPYSHKCKYDKLKKQWSADQEWDEEHEIRQKLIDFLFVGKAAERKQNIGSLIPAPEPILRCASTKLHRREDRPKMPLLSFVECSSTTRVDNEYENKSIPSFVEYQFFCSTLGKGRHHKDVHTSSPYTKNERHHNIEFEMRIDLTKRLSGETDSGSFSPVPDDVFHAMIEEKSSCPGAGDSIPISIWDFAGQSMLYITHQAFLTSHALYCLVFNVNLQLDDTVPDDLHLFGEVNKACIRDFLEFWVNFIITYAKSDQDGYPKILLVGTHIDELPEGSRQSTVEAYFDSLRKFFEGKPAEKHLIVDSKHCVSSIDLDDVGLQHLRQTILHVSESNPKWSEELPLSWIAADKERFNLKKRKIKLISVNEFAKVTSITESTDLDLYLRFQHARGCVVYFSSEKLAGFIVLDPQWIIDVLTSLINTHGVEKVTRRSQRNWNDLPHIGVLEDMQLFQIWKKQPELGLVEQAECEHVLGVMEKLDLVASVQITTDDNTVLRKLYYIPCMVKQSASLQVAIILTLPDQYNQIVYTFRNDFLPPAIFSRLVTRCIRVWKISAIKGEYILYSNRAGFNLDDHHLLLIEKWHNRIYVKVKHKANRIRINPSICVTVQNFITQSLHKIVSVYKPDLKDVKATASNKYPFYIEVVTCETQQGNIKPCFVRVSDDAGKYLTCQKHKSTRVENIWFQDKIPPQAFHRRQECPDNCQGLSKAIRNKCPTEQEIGRLSRRLGGAITFEIFGVNLNLRTEVDINPIQSLTRRGNYPGLKWFYLLRTWMRNSNAAYAELEKALKESDIDCHKLCEIYCVNYTDTELTSDVLDKIPSDKLLKIASQCVGHECLLLGVELGVPSNKIEIIKENGEDYLSIVQQILRYWKENAKNNPTVRTLVCAMKEVGSDITLLKEHLLGKLSDDWDSA